MVWGFLFYALLLNPLNLNVAAGSPAYIVLIYKNLSIFQIFHGSIFIYFYLFFSDFFPTFVPTNERQTLKYICYGY